MKNRVVLREELTVVNIGCTKTFNCNYLSSQGNFIQYQELNAIVTGKLSATKFAPLVALVLYCESRF